MNRVAVVMVIVLAVIGWKATGPHDDKAACMDAGYSPAHCSAFATEKEH